MSYHPHYCTLLYGISCLLDALDGYAARRFNQSTKFGAVLDMVTDRCTTACLLCFLSSAYTKWAILFQGLISLDLASHYMHMYASLDRGATSHKKVEKKRSRILNLYYSNNVCSLILLLRSFFVPSGTNLRLGCPLYLLCCKRSFLPRHVSALFPAVPAN